jgi:magnesium transporter
VHSEAQGLVRHNDVVIVNCAVYRDGIRVPVADGQDLEAVLEAATGDHDFVWLGLHDPSADELNRIAKRFDLHPLAVEDALEAHQRPKLERYGDALFLVLKTLWYVDENDAVETGEINVFVGEDYVVTVRHGSGAELTATRSYLEHSANVLGHGPAAVVYAVCDRVVDEYELVASELEEDVDEVERSVFSPERTNDAERVYLLKREMLEFRRAAIPLREPLQRIVTGGVKNIPVKAIPFYRDVLDHVVRVSDQIEALDSMLTSILNAHMTRINVQQNDDMRRISAWVAIAAVATMLAGIWGMNFTHMPELNWRLGYPLALLAMVVSGVALYRFFRKANWL